MFLVQKGNKEFFIFFCSLAWVAKLNSKTGTNTVDTYCISSTDFSKRNHINAKHILSYLKRGFIVKIPELRKLYITNNLMFS